MRKYVFVVFMAAAYISNSVLAVPVTTGLVAQYDMSSVVKDLSGNVTGWNDLSGTGNNAAQSNSDLQPVFVSSITPTGKSAVKFDGTNDYLAITPSGTTLDGGTWTMFVVYACDALDSGSGSRRIVNFGYADIDPGTAGPQVGATTYCVILGGAGGGVRSGSRTTGNTAKLANSGVPTGYAADTFYIAAATMDSVSATAQGYMITSDGTVYTTTASTGANAVGSGITNARIGCGTSSPSNVTAANFFNGWVSEILIYNRALSITEIKSVTKYISGKYINSQDSLPDGSYKLNRFIDCDAEGCGLDLGSFASYWLEDIPMNDVYSSGGTPIDIAVGDFYEALPGDEFAVIWSAPVSEFSESETVSDTYYTIIIYDSNGIEINRSGRSTHKWKAIAAGDFLSNTGDEIAAISEDADANGYYPIYIFRRGYMLPVITLRPTNAYSIRDITAGNFYTAGDTYDEVAVTYEPGGPMQIDYAKPTDANWSSTTTGLAGRPLQITGGHFYPISNDSIAMITANAINGYYKIYFYMPSASVPFYTAQNSNTVPFTAIAGGRFNAALTMDQVVAAGPVTDGVCQIGYYSATQDGVYKFAGQKAIGTAVAALSCGSLNIPAILGYYERAEGFTAEQADYGSVVNGWGKQTAVLMQDDQGHSIPIFWISNSSSQNQQKYLKVTPVVR